MSLKEAYGALHSSSLWLPSTINNIRVIAREIDETAEITDDGVSVKIKTNEPQKFTGRMQHTFIERLSYQYRNGVLTVKKM